MDLDDPAIWKFIADHMSTAYKEWKCKLHKHFKKFSHDIELAKSTPPVEKVFGEGRTIDQWHWLIDKLYTDEQYQVLKY